MSVKKPKSDVLAAVRAASLDELTAVEFLEKHRWGDAPACPTSPDTKDVGCGSLDVYAMRDAKTGSRNKDFRWRCRDCGRMFTVRTFTVMAETRLPLRVWLHCYWRACASKKGVSALQVSRECEISYKTALHLMHRLREAMASLPSSRPKLSGVVEADETFVGGKPRNKGPWNKRGHAGKIPVVGFVERGGELRYHVMPRLSAEGLAKAMAQDIDTSACLMTDESSAYTAVGRTFAGGHETVQHSQREYVRGNAHNNTIEGAFSLLKRGIFGTFHSVSRKHLHRYASEFEFRYNARHLDDGERIALAVKASEGKRLTYQQQVNGRGTEA